MISFLKRKIFIKAKSIDHYLSNDRDVHQNYVCYNFGKYQMSSIIYQIYHQIYQLSSNIIRHIIQYIIIYIIKYIKHTKYMRYINIYITYISPNSYPLYSVG